VIRWAAGLLAGLMAVSGGRALAQAPPPGDRDAEVTIEVSTSDMVRRTAIFVAAGQALNRAADAGLDAAFGAHQQRKTSDVLIRLGRLWFVNLPIAALSQGSAHDSGHFARDDEFGNMLGGRRIKQWPWPIPIAITVEYGAAPGSFDEYLAEGLPLLGGGEQGSTLTKQRLNDRIYSHDDTGYFDWVLLAYTSLDYPVYAWTDLRTGLLGEPGDFRQYARTMTLLGLPFQPPPPGCEHGCVTTLDGTLAHYDERLRHDAWLNLLDFSLWQAFAHVGRYVVSGQRRTPNATLSIRGIRLVPAAYATLSSLGPERGADVRIVAASFLTRVNVRRISTPDDLSLWGTGVALRSRDAHRFLPEADIDVWQRPGKSAGIRLEAGTMHSMTFAGRPWEAAARAGYKTEGYLLDAPQRATFLASVALSARF
jgi:hypothetical protein